MITSSRSAASGAPSISIQAPASTSHTSTGPNNGYDAFLLALDLDGAHLWSTTWGDGGLAWPSAVAVDGLGDITVVGYVSGPTDLEPGDGSQTHDGLMAEAVLSRFDRDGNWQWARPFGGDGNDEFTDIAFDENGDMIVVGHTSSMVVDFDASDGEALVMTNGYREVVVLRLTPNAALSWLRTLGGDFEDRANAVHIDCDDQIYVAGSFYNDVDFDPGPGVDAIDGGSNSGYVWSLTPSGDHAWASAWAEPAGHDATGVGVSQDRRVVTALNYQGAMDFDPGPGVQNLPGFGLQAAAVAWMRMDTGEF